MLKKLGILLLAFVLLTSIGACGSTRAVEPVPSEGENGDTILDPQPEGEEAEILLYYVNNKYVMTGDESLEKILPVKKYVTVGERSIEGIIVYELQNQPENEELSTVLDNIEILSVETVEDIAYVNISGEELSGGSLIELLILQQLVYSLSEVDEIEAVQLLVDGSKVESLMGHMNIHEPLTKDDIK